MCWTSLSDPEREGVLGDSFDERGFRQRLVKSCCGVSGKGDRGVVGELCGREEGVGDGRGFSRPTEV